jgi:hypothetical protein
LNINNLWNVSQNAFGKSQRSRMGKGAENFQKVFLRRVLIIKV